MKTLAATVETAHTTYPCSLAATCEVLVGVAGSRADLGVVSLTGFGVCGLPAGHERDGHPVCEFHDRFGGTLPFTWLELGGTDQPDRLHHAGRQRRPAARP